jgi:hypothetical protein
LSGWLFRFCCPWVERLDPEALSGKGIQLFGYLFALDWYGQNLTSKEATAGSLPRLRLRPSGTRHVVLWLPQRRVAIHGRPLETCCCRIGSVPSSRDQCGNTAVVEGGTAF